MMNTNLQNNEADDSKISRLIIYTPFKENVLWSQE